MTTVSIVIRTLNEERYLRQLLQAIDQQITEFIHDTIIIDSGSVDNTVSIGEQFGCKILHIKREEFSFGRSLNQACSFSSSKYLVFISGHCIPATRFWLQNLVKPIADGAAQYSYGRQIGGEDTYWSETQIFAKYFGAKSSIPQAGFYCNNANSAILSSVWKQYYFSEELTGLEDMHLAKRLVSDGGIVGYVSQASVYHLHHENWTQVSRRFEREALALQHICPELILRRRDILRYILSSIISDILKGLPRTLKPNQIYYIIAYRSNQYLGSYKGNKRHKKVSSILRESYFYPEPSTGSNESL